MSFCCRVPRHLDNGRNLHLSLVGDRCNLQPEALSNKWEASSMSRNSFMSVIAGLMSSKYPRTLYLVSRGGSLLSCSSRTGPWKGRLWRRIPFNLLSRKRRSGSIPKQNQVPEGLSPCFRDIRLLLMLLPILLLMMGMVVPPSYSLESLSKVSTAAPIFRSTSFTHSSDKKSKADSKSRSAIPQPFSAFPATNTVSLAKLIA